MTFSKLKKFANDHILGTVVTGLVSLATMVGGYLLVSIKSDLDQLQCRIGQFGAKNEYKSLQLKLIVTALDDVNRNSEEFKELAGIITGYRAALKKCSDGEEDLKQIVNYKTGLEGFIDRDWDKAISSFSLITDRTALTEKSIANAYLHKSQDLSAAKDPKAADANRQWLSRIASARELAAREADYSIKEKAVAYMSCNGLLVGAPADEAIECLTSLVTNGQAGYSTYYNLAALNSRIGNFDEALKQMAQCMKMSGALNQRKSDIESDSDFKAMFGDKDFGPKLKKLIARLSI
jgi:tetratricopeptide (TPR) repeat protein